MSDLTREEQAAARACWDDYIRLRREAIYSATDIEKQIAADGAKITLELKMYGVFPALLDMASRCVGEETLEKLAKAQTLADDVSSNALTTELAYLDFNRSAQDDLGAAAEELARRPR
jgi:hypothetical protein